MSIITDALKKAELERQLNKNSGKNTSSVFSEVKGSSSINTIQKENVPNPSMKPYQPETHQSDSQFKSSLIFIITLALIVAGMFLFGNQLLNKKQVIIIPNAAKANNASISGVGADGKFLEEVSPDSLTFSKETQKMTLPANPKTAKAETAKYGPLGAVFSDPSDRYVLTGIIQDPQNPEAIINGQILGLGQTVDGAEISAINSDSVTLKYKDREIQVRL